MLGDKDRAPDLQAVLPREQFGNCCWNALGQPWYPTVSTKQETEEPAEYAMICTFQNPV